MIEEKKNVPMTREQAKFVEQLADGAWKTGGVRDPRDAKTLEDLRAAIREAFGGKPT